MSNIKILVCGDVKNPQRKYGDAGIDVFVPNYSEQFVNDLLDSNPDMTVEGNGGVNIHYSSVTNEYIIQLMPQYDIKIPTYLKTLIPSDMCLRMSNKSGVALKQKLIVGAEIIDASYENDCNIHVFNAGHTITEIHFGQKLAQMVPIKIEPSDIVVYNESELSAEKFYKNHDHSRGLGGFGSTGLY